MAVPIILGVVAAGTAVYGLVKGTSGVIDHNKADDVNKSAQSIVEGARKRVDIQRQSTNDALVDYGARKLRAFNGVIADFVQTFGRLKNVEVSQLSELDKLDLGDFSTQTLDGLREDYQALKDAGLGVGAGLSSGAALAFGAYNGTMMLATASTGTAISTLSGAAATNATLAWLGGGSLAAGGGGMALGTVVLGGIVAGPALAIFGHIMGNKGEEALNTALGNREQAQTIAAEADKAVTQLFAMGQVTCLANNTFSSVSTLLRRAVQDLEHIIAREGVDFGSYTSDGKDAVLRTVKFAQLVKALIDTPILDEQGQLVLSTKKRVEDIALVLA